MKRKEGGFNQFQSHFPNLCVSKAGMSAPSPPYPHHPSGGGGGGYGGPSAHFSQPCLSVANIGPTKILSFLYLGAHQDAMDWELLNAQGISYILNASRTTSQPPWCPDEHFLRIPVDDSYGEQLLPWFNAAFDFIDKVKESNGSVLVHCLAGISRSATIAIGYVMKHFNYTSEEAYRYVKDKRPTIAPNFNFLGQLLELEQSMKTERLKPCSTTPTTTSGLSRALSIPVTAATTPPGISCSSASCSQPYTTPSPSHQPASSVITTQPGSLIARTHSFSGPLHHYRNTHHQQQHSSSGGLSTSPDSAVSKPKRSKVDTQHSFSTPVVNTCDLSPQRPTALPSSLRSTEEDGGLQFLQPVRTPPHSSPSTTMPTSSAPSGTADCGQRASTDLDAFHRMVETSLQVRTPESRPDNPFLTALLTMGEEGLTGAQKPSQEDSLTQKGDAEDSNRSNVETMTSCDVPIATTSSDFEDATALQKRLDLKSVRPFTLPVPTTPPTEESGVCQIEESSEGNLFHFSFASLPQEQASETPESDIENSEIIQSLRNTSSAGTASLPRIPDFKTHTIGSQEQHSCYYPFSLITETIAEMSPTSPSVILLPGSSREITPPVSSLSQEIIYGASCDSRKQFEIPRTSMEDKAASSLEELDSSTKVSSSSSSHSSDHLSTASDPIAARTPRVQQAMPKTIANLIKCHWQKSQSVPSNISSVWVSPTTVKDRVEDISPQPVRLRRESRGDRPRSLHEPGFLEQFQLRGHTPPELLPRSGSCTLLDEMEPSARLSRSQASLSSGSMEIIEVGSS